MPSSSLKALAEQLKKDGIKGVGVVPPDGIEMVKTNTPLDAWIGGLPRNGLTVVEGPVGIGKSTLLKGLATGIREGCSSTTVLTIVPHQQKELVPTCSWLGEALTTDDVLNLIKGHKRADVLMVDELSRYSVDGGGPGARARVWATLARNTRDLFATTVFTSSRRRGAPSASGIGRAADFIIDLVPVARTKKHPGIIVEATLAKSRTGVVGAENALTLWLRPGHQMPITLA